MTSYPPTLLLHDADPGEVIQLEVKEVLYSARSPHQEILIVDLAAHGRALVLDGRLQSAERDEHVYHEALVHPALLLLDDPGPRSVLILGGGEGATLREVLRHQSVARAVMVDLDGRVVAACRKHLPDHHAGAFDDARTVLCIQDAEQHLRRFADRHDAIVFDLVDPGEGGPAAHLFQPAFLRLLQERLEPHGVLAMQYGPVFGASVREAARVLASVRSVFAHVLPGRIFVPSFYGAWGVLVASSRPLVLDAARLDERFGRRLAKSPRSLDGPAAAALFALPPDVRRGLEA